MEENQSLAIPGTLSLGDQCFELRPAVATIGGPRAQRKAKSSIVVVDDDDDDPDIRCRVFFNTGSPEVPTLSLGPFFHPESFFDGPGAR